MAMRFQPRSRARCSLRNSVSRGSGKRRKRKPFASKSEASELFGDGFLLYAMPSCARGNPLSECAFYVFARRGASHTQWYWSGTTEVLTPYVKPRGAIGFLSGDVFPKVLLETDLVGGLDRGLRP